MSNVAARVPTTTGVTMATATTIIDAMAPISAQIVGQAGIELDAIT